MRPHCEPMSDQPKFTDKQQAFINAYLQCWNATKAALMAGYSEKTAYSIGHENLKKPEIAEVIQHRIEEQTMKADEVLVRLTRQARGTFADMVNLYGGLPMLDWEEALINGAIDNVKEITFKEGSITVKLHDSQAALVHLGKHLGLFKDQVQIETWKDKVIGLLRDGKVTPDDVRTELGDSLASELFISAGIPATTSRPT